MGINWWKYKGNGKGARTLRRGTLRLYGRCLKEMRHKRKALFYLSQCLGQFGSDITDVLNLLMILISRQREKYKDLQSHEFIKETRHWYLFHLHHQIGKVIIDLDGLEGLIGKNRRTACHGRSSHGPMNEWSNQHSSTKKMVLNDLGKGIRDALNSFNKTPSVDEKVPIIML